MMFPDLSPVSSRKKRVEALVWTGINKRNLISDNELSDATNITSEDYPAISTRPPREDQGISITAPTSFCKTADGYAWVDGTDFKYEGTTKLTVTAGMKTIVDYNGFLVIFPDKKYYDYVNDTTGTFTVVDGTDPVSFTDALEYQNRVWGVFDSQLWSSKWGDFETWDSFDGVNTDSYAVDVASEGDFVAVAKLQNHVIAFKDDFMYELYGTIPSNFTLQEVAKTGCIDKRSVCEINGTLFFVSRNQVYAYSGGAPRAIGEKLNLSGVTAAVAGTDNRKYYVSITTASETKMYVFDTLAGAWAAEDDLAVLEFAQRDKELFALTDGGAIYQFSSGSETISWEAVTKFYDAAGFHNEYISRILLRMKLAYGASVTVYYRVNHGVWRQVDSVSQDDASYPYLTEKAVVEVDVREYERFQIKMTGTGDAMIYGAKEIITGGDY